MCLVHLLFGFALLLKLLFKNIFPAAFNTMSVSRNVLPIITNHFLCLPHSRLTPPAFLSFLDFGIIERKERRKHQLEEKCEKGQHAGVTDFTTRDSESQFSSATC